MLLYAHPELDVVCVADPSCSEGKILVLGVAIFADSPEEDFASCLMRKLENAAGEVAPVVVQLSGTYVVLHCFADEVEVYTDPAAMRGVYYFEGRAASTPLLLPGVRRDHSLDRMFPFGQPDDWYPGDLCPYMNTKALFANHRLKLATGRADRFWPLQRPSQRQADEAIATASSLMQATIRSALRRWRIVCSITGGKDSRVSLAACGPQVDQIEFFTLRSDNTKACDNEYPAQLAAMFSLRHRIIDVPQPDPGLLQLYDTQVGGMAIGERRRIVSACEQLGGSRVVHLNGNLGAIAKGFYWHNRHPASVRKHSILREFVNRPKPVTDAIDRWVDSLPDVNASTAYNLMYLEQRGGRWMGIGETGSQLFYDSLSLFNNRQVFEALSGLPPRLLSDGSLLKRLVQEMWPELLSVRYCHATRGWSKSLPLSQRVFLKTVSHTLRDMSRGLRHS